MFEGKTVQELDEILEAVAEARKAALAKEKAEKDGIILENLKVVNKGSHVRILYKGEKVEADFVGLTEKRFTVSIDGVKRSIQPDKFVELVA